MLINLNVHEKKIIANTMARTPARFAILDGIESKDPIPVRAAIKAASHRMYKQNLTIWNYFICCRCNFFLNYIIMFK